MRVMRGVGLTAGAIIFLYALLRATDVIPPPETPAEVWNRKAHAIAAEREARCGVYMSGVKKPGDC